MQTFAQDPQVTPLDDPDYPSDDGLPMSDNTLQFLWIVTVQGGLDALFVDDPNIVVAGNCLWYPVEGQPKIRTAPDAMVIFGRPKGIRGSYIQHREGGVPVTVAFEILSPGNRAGEMRRKLAFYDRYGVEEYYILDPDFARHEGYIRGVDGRLAPIPDLFGWNSPRLGIRFEMDRAMPKVLRILRPDGRPFEHYTEIVRERETAERHAEEERARAEKATARAEEERARAEEATARADDAKLRAERLAAQLRALGIDPEA